MEPFDVELGGDRELRIPRWHAIPEGHPMRAIAALLDEETWPEGGTLRLMLLQLLYGLDSEVQLLEMAEHHTLFRHFLGRGPLPSLSDYLRLRADLLFVGAAQRTFAPLIRRLRAEDLLYRSPFRIDQERLSAWTHGDWFAFESLARLSDRDIQRLLKDFDLRSLGIALLETEPEVLNRFVSNLSSRTGDILRQEMTFLSHIRRQDILEVRRHLVRLAERLIQAGVIDPPPTLPD